MMRRLRILLLSVMLGCMPSSWATEEEVGGLRKFVDGSYTQLRQSQQGQAFLLVLWSLDCPPCYQELAMLGRLRQQGQVPRMVIIATDSHASAEDVLGVLQESGLQDVDAWQFAQAPARLRHQIDPAWRGELPRSYFYTADHQRTAHSGILRAEQVQSWWARVSRQ